MTQQSEQVLRPLKFDVEALDIEDVLIPLLSLVDSREEDIGRYVRKSARFCGQTPFLIDHITTNAFQNQPALLEDHRDDLLEGRRGEFLSFNPIHRNLGIFVGVVVVELHRGYGEA